MGNEQNALRVAVAGQRMAFSGSNILGGGATELRDIMMTK